MSDITDPIEQAVRITLWFFLIIVALVAIIVGLIMYFN